MASNSPLRALLKHARETLDDCLPSDQSTSQLKSDGLDGKVKELLYAVTAAGAANSRIELSHEEKGDVWHIVVKLWVSKTVNLGWLSLACMVSREALGVHCTPETSRW